MPLGTVDTNHGKKYCKHKFPQFKGVATTPVAIIWFFGTETPTIKQQRRMESMEGLSWYRPEDKDEKDEQDEEEKKKAEEEAKAQAEEQEEDKEEETTIISMLEDLVFWRNGEII